MFGRYTKRTYKKNSEKIKNKLIELLSNCNIPQDIALILNKAIMNIESNHEEIPSGWNAAALKAIDAKICEYIEKLYEDHQEQKYGMLKFYADAVCSMTGDRPFGRLTQDYEYLNLQELAAELRCWIAINMDKRDEIDRQMKEIAAETDDVKDDDPRFIMSEMRYTELRHEQDQCESVLQVYKRELDDVMKAIETRIRPNFKRDIQGE